MCKIYETYLDADALSVAPRGYIRLSLIVPRKLAVTTLRLHQCNNMFSGRFKLLSLLQQSEGNTLAETEFIRLLEASGSITAKQSSGARENTQSLGSTAEFNQNVTLM